MSVQAALERLNRETEELREQRSEVLTDGSARAIHPERLGRMAQLGLQRADVLLRLEEDRRKLKATFDRVEEIRRYRSDLRDEFDRITRSRGRGDRSRRPSHYPLPSL